MSNKLPFPRTDREFMDMFPNEGACTEYLAALKWPEGFECPHCESHEGYWNSKRLYFECKYCHRQTYLTAGTVMHSSKIPLTEWFWAAWLMATLKPGISALQYWERSHIGSYETVFNMLHKLRFGLVDPNPYILEGMVEVDEALLWGKKPPKGVNRGPWGKIVVAGAVELVERKEKKRYLPDYYVNRVRLRVVPNRSEEHLAGFVYDAVAPGSIVYTDAHASYQNLDAYYDHHVISETRGIDADDVLPAFHQVIGNFRAWLIGTHHGVSPKHMQTYANEFAFRISTKFDKFLAFQQMLGFSLLDRGPTYPELYNVGQHGGYAHLGDVNLGWLPIETF